MVVISNTSPLIYLAALSDFELLPKLFGTIYIPGAVWTETVEQGGDLPGREATRHAVAEGWLRLIPLPIPAEPIRAVGRLLHTGETEVIKLAQIMTANVLLMDDRLAVEQARSLGFHVVPTIAIYIMAKRKQLVKSVKDKADRLRDIGFRLTDRDYRAVLGAAGEL